MLIRQFFFVNLNMIANELVSNDFGWLSFSCLPMLMVAEKSCVCIPYGNDPLHTSSYHLHNTHHHKKKTTNIEQVNHKHKLYLITGLITSMGHHCYSTTQKSLSKHDKSLLIGFSDLCMCVCERFVYVCVWDKAR